MLAGQCTQLQKLFKSSERNVQASPCSQLPSVNMRGQLRCSTSTASCVWQQATHAAQALAPQLKGRKRNIIVPAALGNGTNGNGKPADEGKRQMQHLLPDPLSPSWLIGSACTSITYTQPH